MIDGIVDFHMHSAPSIIPRHSTDADAVAEARGAGITTAVLKAHEGSSAARARIIGPGAVGGVVLNSPVGGANPDAVRVAALLGGRLVWMPTISSPAHRRAHANPELNAHRGVSFREVPVLERGELRAEWLEVFEEVAQADLVLASGHLTMDETVLCFRAAHALGVRRFLVNHPLMPFLGWRAEHATALRALDARIEVGVLADLLRLEQPGGTAHLCGVYPAELLVFGSDLGHSDYPTLATGIDAWLTRLRTEVPEDVLCRVLTVNGRDLLG